MDPRCSQQQRLVSPCFINLVQVSREALLIPVVFQTPGEADSSYTQVFMDVTARQTVLGDLTMAFQYLKQKVINVTFNLSPLH